MHSPEMTHSTLKDLLQSELAATRSYRQVLDILAHAPGAVDLRRIHDEHREAADTLRLQICEVVGDAADNFATSTAPVAWNIVFEESATEPGPRVAALTLKQHEEVGVEDYERALQNEHLPPHHKVIIHERLLPHTREHVATLERILEIL